MSMVAHGFSSVLRNRKNDILRLSKLVRDEEDMSYIDLYVLSDLSLRLYPAL
jgi:hypothetical protein